MNVIIAGHDSLGVVMANILSEAGHRVSIVATEGNHLMSMPKYLTDREHVTLLEANPVLDETMLQMGIRRCDAYIAAMQSGPANGLAALKAKITYRVDKVAAVVTDDSLAKVYPRFGVITINPYSLVLNSLSDALEAIDVVEGTSDD